MTSKIPMMLFSGFFGGQDCVHYRPHGVIRYHRRHRRITRTTALPALSSTALMMVFVISPAFAFFALSMIRYRRGLLGAGMRRVQV